MDRADGKGNNDAQNFLNSLREVIPKQGELFHEKRGYVEVLCKPKILPLKSLTLLKLEQMEQDLNAQAKMREQD